jgi:DNA-binding NtrC family response regulator
MHDETVIHEIHERYRQRARSLNELERRLWAATEAMKLGRGGITAVSKALRISRTTIRRGIQELATGQADSNSRANARIRKVGGGRKSR